MRYKWNPLLRYSLIGIMVILVIVGGIKLYQQFAHPAMVEKEQSTFNYNQKGDINYEVLVKSNPLYSHDRLEEGKSYLVNFVDQLLTSYSYEFSAGEPIDLQGTYEVKATLNGYLGESEEREALWSKDYTFVPQKEFNQTTDNLQLNDTYDINLKDFYEFVAKVNEASEVGTMSELTVSFLVNINGDTESGPIQEQTEATMVLPLNGKVLTVGGQLTNEKEGVVVDTTSVKDPSTQKAIWGYSFLVIVGVLSIIGVLYFTKPFREKDPKKREIHQVFKKYGTRLVAIDEEIIYENNRAIPVRSFEDLVRISDDVLQPIMYLEDEGMRFYVLNENKVYYYEFQHAEKRLYSESQVKDVGM